MKVPCSTYRLQFNASFTFTAARGMIEYLARLGIDCLYASPIFKAHKGSAHGYDIIDPNAINNEIGTDEEFIALAHAAQQNGMQWLQDIVPNHMAYSGENRLIIDILENGQSSQFIGFFDIDWQHPYESIHGKLLAPFLGRFYGESLEAGEIQLKYDPEGLHIGYYETRLPLRMESYVKVFSLQLSSLKKTLGADHPDLIRLLGVLYTLKNLPPTEEGAERYNHITFIKKLLWELYSKNRQIKEFVDNNLEVLNGNQGNPDSYDLLEKILSEQLFRLSFWKMAAEEINYRRFFNINELISLKIEEPGVFDYIHSLVLRCIKDKYISALRVDHIDGLYDPERYLAQLREKVGDIPLFVEKILALGEEIPSDWPVQGTTGYDFLNYVNGLFCKRESEDSFTRMYKRFVNFSMDFKNLVFDKKRLIIGKYMAGDIDNLARLMKKISNRYRYGNDITLYGLKRALVDVLALFPVYRTYISYANFGEFDRIVMTRVLEKARETNPGYSHELNFIENFLLLNFKEYFSEDDRRQWIHFVMRFQQFTGPLMAKGVEDTVLYVYNRLLSLNEVGGNPGKFGIPLEEFHQFNCRRAKRWINSLNATSTHDSKRGEDARARINVLTDLPAEWRQNVKLWSLINREKKVSRGGQEIPSKNDEYLLYQTLIGSFPFYEHEYDDFVARVKTYAIKAVREAKVYTAWLKPDEEYENGFLRFIDALLAPSESNEFLRQFVPFQKMIADYGIFNSLSQTLLKITCPGIPDFYQGTELWDLNMVDPDNRRPVDFRCRARLLDEIVARERSYLPGLIDELLHTKEDGRVKLFMIYRALNARHRFHALFADGSYVPLRAIGKQREHIVAFLRRHGDQWALSVVPRFMVGLLKSGQYIAGTDVWGDTALPLPDEAPHTWTDAITGNNVSSVDRIAAVDALRSFPVSLLLSEKQERGEV